jgi:hypothetical protein
MENLDILYNTCLVCRAVGGRLLQGKRDNIKIDFENVLRRSWADVSDLRLCLFADCSISAAELRGSAATALVKGPISAIGGLTVR